MCEIVKATHTASITDVKLIRGLQSVHQTIGNINVITESFSKITLWICCIVPRSRRDLQHNCEADESKYLIGLNKKVERIKQKVEENAIGWRATFHLKQ